MGVVLVICELDCDPDNIEPYKSAELGSYEYLNCYFNTISSLLEDKKWGSRFPILLESLDAKTKIEPDAAEEMASELAVITQELKNQPPANIDCNIDTEESNWMLEAPFDTFADNIYDYFLTLEENNLTKTFYDFASEAAEENLSLIYIIE
ncbi:MAG: hypothetical protein ACD_20C00383G0015 [uncultured bacterium]|nr:MAG: hypothetical protein ACD_20C00383G0015 [uncultured bacterium]HBH17486.1 hypothetical protein [Cyanobacteria bacterium UBA9579]